MMPFTSSKRKPEIRLYQNSKINISWKSKTRYKLLTSLLKQILPRNNQTRSKRTKYHLRENLQDLPKRAQQAMIISLNSAVLLHSSRSSISQKQTKTRRSRSKMRKNRLSPTRSRAKPN